MNLKSFSELFILASFYFSTLCFKVIDKNLFVLYFVCCSIFKDRFAPLVSSAHVVYHIIPRLSTPFFKFFHIFSPFSRNVKSDHFRGRSVGYFAQTNHISAKKASTEASLVAQDAVILTRCAPFGCTPQSSTTKPFAASSSSFSSESKKNC